MFVGVLQVEIEIPESFSLKDKRHVVRGLLERLRAAHAVSAAEVSALDTWNRAVLGIAFVSNEARHAESHLQHVLNALEEDRGFRVADSSIEVF